jgi:pyruvate dehydrogenase E2 component (dihydrolipoyllysine-residue acetyltransferase)
MSSGSSSELVSDPFEPPSVLQPLTAMRRVVGARLAESKRTAPHFYLSVDLDLEEVLALRSGFKEARDCYTPSINDFIVCAVARALTATPTLNARLEGTQVRCFSAVNIGVAVSLGSGGLVVPIVRDASQSEIFQIGSAIRELAQRARSNKLTPDDYRGGTFTVSNLGMFGVREFIAILNPPQAGILALGQAAPRAVVRDGKVCVATLLTATLSADHRVVDGATGAEFLQALQGILCNPTILLTRPGG